jgi:hypothetical protein
MALLSVAEIEQRLRDNAESVALRCLSGGRKEGNYVVAGDVMGTAGSSLVVNIKGAQAGRWRDYAADQGGDMLDLIGATQGCSTKGQMVAIAKQWLGIDDDWQARGGSAPDPAEQARRAAELARVKAERQRADAEERQAKIRGARSLYLSGDAKGVSGTPVEQYLQGRGLDVGTLGRWPGALRFHPEVWNADERCKVPAMLAPVYLHDGLHVATHRTWLQPDKRRGWVKLDSRCPKKVLGPMWGGFIPINKGTSGKSMRAMPEDEPVYMTEGIEDALVVRMVRPEARIVCAISLGNVGAVVLPPQAKRLVIVADRDEKEAAIEALERSIAQQQARGLHVRLVMPPVGFKDLNAWLLARLRGAAVRKATEGRAA